MRIIVATLSFSLSISICSGVRFETSQKGQPVSPKSFYRSELLKKSIATDDPIVSSQRSRKSREVRENFTQVGETNLPPDEWFCDGQSDYCFYKSSVTKPWLEAFESCSAIGGMLPFWLERKDTTRFNATQWQSWSSLIWLNGRWHEFDENTYSFSHLSHLTVGETVLRPIVQRKLCFAVSTPNWQNDSVLIHSNHSDLRIGGYDCNSKLPFMCISFQTTFKKTQKNLRLPLRVVKDIRIVKEFDTSSMDLGEVLRCFTELDETYSLSESRPFSIVWLLDDAYYPKEGIRNFGLSTVLRVPFKRFTKYSCEVRYLGSIHGNKSQEIEVAGSSVSKLGFAVRFRNRTTRLDYSAELKKMQQAFKEDPEINLTLSEVGARLYELTDDEFISVAYFEHKLQARDRRDKIELEQTIDVINNLWTYGPPPITNQLTREATQYFRDGVRDGTLAGVHLFSVDRCPVEDVGTYVSFGSAGKQVLLRSEELRRDAEFGICYNEFNYPASRTCSGSLVTGAQWVEPFDPEKNCSRPSSKSFPQCPTDFTLVLKDDDFCAKVVEADNWDETMNACFQDDLLTRLLLSPGPLEYKSYNTTGWISSTMDYVSQHPNSSWVLNGLLWLPLKRRVPGGLFYPYFFQQNAKISGDGFDDWLIELFDYASAKDPSILGFDTNTLCLAWSVTNKTLAPRDCSERHPLVCIRPAVSSETWAKSLQRVTLNPEKFYLPNCRGFQLLVPDQYGVHSCYKTITPRVVDKAAQSKFTWDEAAEQCKAENARALLAFPKSEILKAVLGKFQSESVPTWLGIRQLRLETNSSCRFVTASSACANMSYRFTDDTDFLHGLHMSARQILPTNPQIQQSTPPVTVKVTLNLPGTKLPQAICQVDLDQAIGDGSPLTYHLKLSWSSSIGDEVKISVTEEGKKTPGFNWKSLKDENCGFIFTHLLCFGDGNLLRIRYDRGSSCQTVVNFPFNITSFYCESLTRDARLLRSNTLPWRHSYRTFVLSVWDTRFLTTSGTSANYSKIVLQSFKNRFLYNNQSNPSTALFFFPFDWSRYLQISERYGTYHLTTRNEEKRTQNLSVAYKQLWEDLQGVSNATDSVRIRWLRSMVACLEDVVQGSFGNLTWLETPLGVTSHSQEGCIVSGSHALIQRTCAGDIYSGAYWGPLQVKNTRGRLENVPVNFTCLPLSETTASLLDLTTTHLNSSSVLNELRRITDAWDPIVADVQLSAAVFFRTSKEGKYFPQNDIDNTAIIFDNILQVETETLVKAQKMSNISTQLLVGLEDVLTNTQENHSSLLSHELRGETTVLGRLSSVLFVGNSTRLGKRRDKVSFTQIVPDSNYSSINVTEYDAVVSVTTRSLSTPRESAPIIGFIYHTTVRLADAAVVSRKDSTTVFTPSSDNGDEEKPLKAKYVASSAMVQVGVTKGNTSNLEFPVNIFFRPFVTIDREAPSNNHVCVFWNPKVNSGNGGWSTSGCWQQGYADGLIHCQCNHLSAFTALIAYEEKYESTFHDAILDTITMVGCGLSLLGCIGVIATYVILPKWRTPKPGFYFNHVLFHMSLALGLLLSTFLGGFEQTSNPWACLCVAAVIHYLTLVTFCWMMVEAYCHYSLFIRVWGRHTSTFMLKASLFAWLLPLAPTIAGLILHSELYYYTNYNLYCWLKPKGFYYLLLPFASLVAIGNTSLYVFIVVKLGCVKVKLGNTQRQNNFTLHTAIAIFLLLGLSWTFGLLAIGQARLFFSYLFCIFNSLQGFAFFVFFILRGNLARQEWRKVLERNNEPEPGRERSFENAKHGAVSGPTSGNDDSSQVTSNKSTSASLSEQVLLELRARRMMPRIPTKRT